MVTRFTRQDAARQLKISITTLDRRLARGELETVKEPFGSRERVYVLLEDSSHVSPTGNGAGNGAGSTTDHTDHSHLAVLQTQVKAMEELADYHRAQLTEADRRQQMLLTNLHSAHQIIEALTRVLPAPEMALTTQKRPWAWLTWWKQKP